MYWFIMTTVYHWFWLWCFSIWSGSRFVPQNVNWVGEKHCFASRSLTKIERKYSQLDKEALAIIFVVKKFHQYVYGRLFTLKTHHKPLTYIFRDTKATPTMASRRIQRWDLTLGAYSYQIKYKKGEQNTNADALSRLSSSTASKDSPQVAQVVHLMEYLDTSPVLSNQIRQWTDRDPVLCKFVTGFSVDGQN